MSGGGGEPPEQPLRLMVSIVNQAGGYVAGWYADEVYHVRCNPMTLEGVWVYSPNGETIAGNNPSLSSVEAFIKDAIERGGYRLDDIVAEKTSGDAIDVSEYEIIG